MGDDDSDVSLTPQEQFFLAASKGDVAVIKALLDGRPENGVDMDAKDESGLSALNLAITEGYLGVMYPLLEGNAHIGDAMLRAVDADFHEAVRTLLQFAEERDESGRMAIINCRCESSDIHPDITPMIRAAQLNSFAIVKMLLEADLLIPELNTDAFQDEAADDLQRSVGTLEIYGGLASEAYVCLASTDPIDRAFTLCGIMKRIAILEVEFKVRYLELADKMERLAAELVSYARDSEEINTVLTFQETNALNGGAQNQRHVGNIPKVTQAIQYEQRQFVAHPNTQQAVSAQFYRHLAHLRDEPPLVNFLAFIGLVVAFPFFSILYKLGVSTHIRHLVRTPYVKFVMQAGADFSMLVILLNIDTSSHLHNIIMTRNQYIVHFILLLFVVGLSWKEMYLAYLCGIRKIMSSFEHIRDTLISILLMVYFVLTFLSMFQDSGTCPAAPTIDPNAVNVLENSTTNIGGITRLRLEEIELNGPSRDVAIDIIIEILADLRCVSSPALQMDEAEVTTGPPSTSDCEKTNSILSRKWNDPSLIGNGIFGIVTVLAFTKLMSFLIANDFVGPLVISVGDMVKRTSSFFIFVIAVIISFSSAMTFNYNIYSQGDIERCETNDAHGDCGRSYEYRNLGRSMMSLYWSLFGLIDRDSLNIKATPDVIRGAGELLYGAFYIFAVLVLLNALIAVMSNVFNKVEENADVEWKFARTTLWMSFLNDTVTVPPPFNLLPDCSQLKQRLKLWWQMCRRRRNIQTEVLRDSLKLNDMQKRKRTYKRVDLSNYQRIMRRLVERFVAERTAQEANAQGGITVADIRNLRNDVVGLRYETFKQLCQMNEELDRSKQQSSAISGQSNQASVVFTRTDKIKDEVHEYSSGLAEVQSELSQKLKILPALEELMRELAEMHKASGVPEQWGKRVQDMVGYYEEVKDIVAASKDRQVRTSSFNLRPGVNVTSEDEDGQKSKVSSSGSNYSKVNFRF
ncbi:short transient receptor potential channel 3 isoform X1 [Strongylocentrotus purpuratus]|uniref:Transient receptor ion channel domain-containing protein n=1 Tax=Strongylocentrotus purpuratus TaxID=7668 RepID=A0A7M7HDZ7_STRPU|nr:short transient receptor potential channel 3 isoform X1 [Strongylocentrotus purpuratus]XP_011666683.2 short transient receptor potential channel 3 isoform X1 [Strongylocentrotus purpuratus]XP_030833541.1 short transient receptor potential channel 3 isoform X1 [Strongylocentrotus purpuratus]XP_030833542.1 short transient receptor potential channel 3 isoform X1 [Strongylocentrotus purpuratus]